MGLDILCASFQTATVPLPGQALLSKYSALTPAQTCTALQQCTVSQILEGVPMFSVNITATQRYKHTVPCEAQESWALIAPVITATCKFSPIVTLLLLQVKLSRLSWFKLNNGAITKCSEINKSFTVTAYCYNTPNRCRRSYLITNSLFSVISKKCFDVKV